MKFDHSTPEQLGAELRERFKTANGVRSARIAQWMLTRTDTQLRTLFGMTQAQVNALKTRLANKVTALTNLRNQVGE